MPQKIFTTCLELEIRSVTCPGVWLCSNGRVSLVIETLGSQHETKLLPSLFPLVFHEVFQFKQRIDNADSLQSLKSALDEEYLHCELIQWSHRPMHNKGKILAKYKGRLSDLLYPSNVFFNNSVDLLMKATKNFPGIISPKINVITKIQIHETMNNEKQFVNDSKMSNNHRYRISSEKNSKRQNTVCHSHNYNFLNGTKSDEDMNYNKLILSNDNCQHGCINHNWSMCSICLEYHKLFRNIPSTEEYSNDLTYEIPEEHLLSKNCKKILGKEFVNNRLEYLFLDHEILARKNKFRKSKKKIKHSCCNTKYDCDDLQRKFDAIRLRCLCEE